MKFWALRVFLFSFIRYYFYHHYKKCPSKNARVAISRKENVQSGIARPHVGDKTWKVATKSSRQSDQVPHWRDHSQQQMAGQPWAGDNRVARPRWMDDMYTINIRQTLCRAPLCEVGLRTTVEMDGAVQGQARGYLAGKPATWTFEKPASSTFDKTSA